MKVIRIVYYKYLNDNGEIVVGGAENYIRNLAMIFKENGFSTVLYQYATNSFEKRVGEIKVIGVKGAKTPKNLITYIDKNDHDYETDILIFGTDIMIAKNKFKNSIAIQHGIAWDITLRNEVSHFKNYVWIVKGMLRSFVKYERYKNCKNLVCVDYNFINWYRTQIAHIDINCFCIPNFTQISPDRKYSDNVVSIIFARRFVEYRGTKLFTYALLNVLRKHPNIKVTIAGTGPDEQWMREKLNEYSNIVFTTFEATESHNIHLKHDIAVVPTIGSEGTSLSLLEAMSAGCAVIATNVGGMTNIILDGYNGLLISPKEEALEEAINRLIEDAVLRMKLSQKAQETVKASFSFEKWKNSWYECIRKIQK